MCLSMYQILLVDDEPIARMAFCNLLDWKATPYEIAGTANSGEEALAFLRDHPVDILITDLKMPQMDGLELINRLSDQNFPGVILVMSSYSDFDLVREALLSGAQDYILKVNMDQKSILPQLNQAIMKLAKSHVDEVPPSQQLSLLNREALLYACLHGKQEDDVASAHAEKLLPHPPYALFDVLLESVTSAKQHSEKSIRSLLCSILDEVDILCLSSTEYLCLASIGSNSVDKTYRQSKAVQITRQLQMYPNCRCCVFFAELVNDRLTELRAKYVLCQQGHQLLFYAQFPARYHAADVCLQPLRAEHSPDVAAQLLTERFYALGITGLDACIDKFVGNCAAQNILPQDVRNYAYQIVQVLLLSATLPTDIPVFSRHTALLSCNTVLEIRSILLELLPCLMEKSLPAVYQGCNKEIKAALLYIQYHYTRKVTLDDLATAVNLDKSYLCRLFKKEIGQNIFQYLKEQRMKRAAEMIAGGNIYIREVAAAVGFEDPFYFTRLFKKYYGVSPSEYKSASGGNDSTK